MNGWSKLDKFYVLSSAAVALLCAYLLQSDQLLRSLLDLNPEPSMLVGEVLQTHNDTRRKFGRNHSWFGISESDQLFARDSIYTGDHSNMKVKLQEMGELSIHSNSLLQLVRYEGDIILNFSFGEALIKLYKGKKLNLFQNGQRISLTSQETTELKMTRDRRGDIRLQSQNQAANLKINDQKFSIKPEDSLQIQSGKITKQTAPAPEIAKIEKPIVKKAVQVKKPKQPKPKRKALVKKPPKKNVTKKKKQRKKARSTASVKKPMFTLPAPTPALPTSGVTIISYNSQSGDPIVFSWSAIKQAKAYKLQISNSPSFKKLIVDKEVSENQFVLTDKVPAGTMHWRVRALKGKELSRWSKPSSFKMSQQ